MPPLPDAIILVLAPFAPLFSSRVWRHRKHSVGHFPTDTYLLEKLHWIEQQQNPKGHLWHWCREFERRQDDPSRWRYLLEQWLAQSPSMARLKIVGNAILWNGSRHDLQLLTKYRIEDSHEQLERLLADVGFAVMRRSLN